MLRFYRSPPKYDLYLAKIFNILVFIGIIIHYLFGIWIYGNPNLLTNRINDPLKNFFDTIKNSINSSAMSEFMKEIINRITVTHNILLGSFLVLIFVILILQVTLFQILSLIFSKSITKDETLESLERKNMEIGLGKSFKFILFKYFFN